MRYAQRGGYTPAEQQRREQLRLEAAGRFARGDTVSEINPDASALEHGVERLCEAGVPADSPDKERCLLPGDQSRGEAGEHAPPAGPAPTHSHVALVRESAARPIPHPPRAARQGHEI
jgi:hypothetical protein